MWGLISLYSRVRSGGLISSVGPLRCVFCPALKSLIEKSGRGGQEPDHGVHQPPPSIFQWIEHLLKTLKTRRIVPTRVSPKPG